jgi:hypothetical protein
MLHWNRFAARAPTRPTRLVPSILLSIAATALAPTAAAQVHYLKTFLLGNQAVPPANTNSLGYGCFVLDAGANTLSYYVNTQLSNGTMSAAHLHGFAAPGVAAGVLFDLPVGDPMVGSVALTPAQTAGILSGLVYVDVHTVPNFPDDPEIRGQIVQADPPVESCFGDGSVAACPCGNESPAGAGGCLNSLGLAGKLEASGFASTHCDNLSLIASNMSGSTTIYLQGWWTQPLAPVLFGDGVRCAGGVLTRIAVVQNVGGTSQIPWPGGPSLSVLGHVEASSTPYVYQAYYRDPDPNHCTGATFSVTNAVTVRWVL